VTIWLFVGLGNPQERVEGPVNLPVRVAVLPEMAPRNTSSTQSSSPVYQCGKYSMFVGWMVIIAGVSVEAGMGRFTVHFMAQRTIGSSVNIYVKEGKVAISVSMVN
jgi:hypothetical protein